MRSVRSAVSSGCVLLAVALFAPSAASAAEAAGAPTYDVDVFSSGLSAGARPEGLVASGGYMWFADAGSPGAIGRVDPATGAITEYSSGLQSGSRPQQIAAATGGKLWFTDDGSKAAIGRFDVVTHEATEYSAGLQAGSAPAGITAGPDEAMWFADPGDDAVGRIDASGNITEDKPESGEADSDDIVLGPDDNIYYTDRSEPSRFGLTDPYSQHMISLAFDPSVSFTGLTASANGQLWLGDDGFTRSIARYIPAAVHSNGGLEPEFAARGLAVGVVPGRLASDPQDDVWFADLGTVKGLARFAAAGPGPVEEFATGSAPGFLAPGPNASMWFTSSRGVGRVVVHAPEAARKSGELIKEPTLAPVRASVELTRIVPSVFAPARRGGPMKKAHASPTRGTIVSVTLSAPGVVRFVVQRAVRGTRAGKSCTPGRAPRGAHACTAFVRVGAFSRTLTSTTGRFLFTGRVGGHALKPGEYRLKTVVGAGRPVFAPFDVR
jgi:virginiamycin B lyase